MKIEFKKNASGIFLPTEDDNRLKVLDNLSLQNTCYRVGCASISAGVAADCNTKPVAGTEVTIYLANRSDIDELTPNVTNSLIIEGITMVALKKFYAFTGIKASNNPSVKMNKGKFINNWEHLLDFLVFANDGATKKIIMDLSNAEVVAIVQNKWKGTAGNMAYEMYGYSSGLVLTSAERNPNDAETGGAWKLTMTHDDGQFEDKVPLTIFDTDLATTTTLITGLL